MSKITIDGTEYDIDALSDEAKANLMSIQFVEAEIERLKNKMAVLQTAKISYARELQSKLPMQGDTIKFN